MAFINERQTNKQAKKTFKKNQNYSRFPLTNDDNYIIMANITNNNKQCFERLQMNFSDLCAACVFGVLSAWLWVAVVTL